jgi:hypothetical protein
MRSPQRVLAGSLAVLAAVTLAACVPPVTPSVTFSRSTFEGFSVISYVPDHPKAVIYLFHGSLGSADFATKVETTDTLNAFIAEGYGFVSTESTERTGGKRWDQSDPSLTTNPDLARLVRLQANLVATTPMDARTPLVGIGMSNGARFVTLWGQTWKAAGYPVRAIWASMGKTASPVAASGALTVPTVFSTASNDSTVPPAGVVASYLAVQRSGTPTQLFVSGERNLTPLQYERIPGISPTTANGIVAALEATGVWDANGTRVVSDVQAAVAQASTARLPAAVAAAGAGNEVANETSVLLAIHQFTAEFTKPVRAFFDTYVG